MTGSLHGLRATVITMPERAAGPESTVRDIAGHERSPLTGGTRGGESALEMRREALAKPVCPGVALPTRSESRNYLAPAAFSPSVDVVT